MKIKSVEQLIDIISSDQSRRKQELISHRGAIVDARSKLKNMLCRSGVVFAYAHWEGFVKYTSGKYVEFVASKSRKLADLAVNFQALACRRQVLGAGKATRKIRPHIDIIMRLVDKIDTSVSMPFKGAIDTESNLKYQVFENISMTIGVENGTAWEVCKPQMDDLVRNRCAIAHGEHYSPDEKYSIECIDATIQWIDRFSDDVCVAARDGKYLR